MEKKVFHKGKHVGFMRGGKLVKVDKQVVLFNKYDGWEVSADILNKEKPTHVQLFIGNQAYQAKREQFRTNGIVHWDGDDKQYILPKKYWEFKDLNQQELIKE